MLMPVYPVNKYTRDVDWLFRGVPGPLHKAGSPLCGDRPTFPPVRFQEGHPELALCG